jgi:hypothetical protein
MGCGNGLPSLYLPKQESEGTMTVRRDTRPGLHKETTVQATATTTKRITSTKLTKSALLAGAAAAVPAVLFLGAGTAQAETDINTTTDALGVTVHIASLGPNPTSGSCTYTAVPVNVPPGVLPPLPVRDVPFFLQEHGFHELWFPGVQTGTTWNATVKCENGTNSPTEQVTY